jgi:SsrA-binding protein
MAQEKKETPRILCQNRKARHEYHIDEVFEAGLVLTGTEIKSLRGGRGSLQEAFAQVKGNEAWIHQFHIPPYEQGNQFNVDPVRPRKLLLHRRELGRLAGEVSRKGYTLVPLDVHLVRGRAKLLLGLARGKKLFDKREDMKRRDTQRDMERAMRGRRDS